MRSIKNIISVFLCAAIVFNFTACTINKSQNNNTKNAVETSAEEIAQEQKEQSPEYIELNEDGVAPLDGKYTANVYIYDSCYDRIDGGYIIPPGYDEDNLWFNIILKNANERIIKLRQNDTAAIYTSEKSITFWKIDSQPKYTVPLSFRDVEKDEVDSITKVPRYFGNNVYVNHQNTENTDVHKLSIDEINGQPMENYIKNSCYDFAQSALTVILAHKLLICKKNEEVVFGGYEGTQWEEATLYADIEFYKVPNDSKFEIEPQKTKNGYFTVDLSKLEPGLYFVETFKNFIEIV
ncbi:MAG: hypothetical protein IKE65_09485 [Clostridia bacterium]|nr:hypothetical protein [Clostridia bacterium]